jgi:pilus assembly protein CpaF
MPASVKLLIRRPDKDPAVFDIVEGVYTVGSDEDCKLLLSHPDVDGRHAILTVRDRALWIEDLNSRTGTFVNADRIDTRVELEPGAEIGVGPFVLMLFRDAASLARHLQSDNGEPAPPEPPAAAPPSRPAPAAETRSPAAESLLRRKQAVKQQLHRELVERLDLKRLTSSRIGEEELRNRALGTIRSIVREVAGRLPAGIDPETLTREICDEALGLGPLEAFLADPDITEIMVNGHDQVYIEKEGKLVRTEQTFMDDASVLAIIERIVSPIGRRIDESQPYVDARLADGSRVNAIIHPLSLVGPCLTIRKFSKTPFTDRDLMGFGTLTRGIADFLSVCVRLRKNIVVSGGTGSGKTTLLNVLSNYLPGTDRIVTIEDAAELRLTQEHVVRLEARPPNIEGRGAISIRDLVRNALRMRPDRIVVGECRGGEALDMLQAMNTGHDGSLTTVHANSPRDVISRLETMVLMSGMELPLKAVREQIAAAIDLIVHESRFSDGSRKITNVTEVVGLEGDQITMQNIFEFKQTGVDPDERVVGSFYPTGAVPTFIEDIAARGLQIDRSIFDPGRRKD